MATATTNPRSAVLFNGAHNTVNQTRATLGTANCFRLANEHLLPSMAPKIFTAVAGEDFVRVAPRQMAYVTFDGAIFDGDPSPGPDDDQGFMKVAFRLLPRRSSRQPDDWPLAIALRCDDCCVCVLCGCVAMRAVHVCAVLYVMVCTCSALPSGHADTTSPYGANSDHRV